MAQSGGKSGEHEARPNEQKSRAYDAHAVHPHISGIQLGRARAATLLAVLTVLASVLVAYFAYQGSRRALTQQLAQTSKVLAYSVRAHSEGLAAAGVPPESALEQAWARSHGEQQGLYLCFVGSDGKLDVHTRFADRVGVDVNRMTASNPEEVPSVVRDLLREKRSWTGTNLDLQGYPQIVSFAYSEPLEGLVTVHVPQAMIDGYARAGMLPWAYGMGLVVLLLFPAAFWLLHGAHRRAERALAAAHAQRAELTEQLGHSRKLESLGRLASGVAHDFNNLLMVVLGSVDGLAEEKLSSEGKQDVEDIRAAADRGSKLVKQLLVFGAKQKTRETVLDTSQLLHGLTGMLERVLGHGTTLELDLDEAHHAIRADRGQIEQVLTNLVINARDAMPKGGRIRIATTEVTCPGDYLSEPSESGRCVRLSVEDEGVGMTNEVLERAMDPFFTTKGAKGTGLGLATAYAITKQHGGHLRVDSEPGKGTTVSLYLPIVEGAATPDPPHSEAVAISAGGRSVLVVEDEERVRNSVVRGLEKAGYRVTTASNAREARQLFKGSERPFELLVADVVMPGESGEQLARNLLEVDEKLRVLLISGYAPTATAQSPDDPRIAFLEKPFTGTALKTKLAELVHQTAH